MSLFAALILGITGISRDTWKLPAIVTTVIAGSIFFLVFFVLSFC